MKSIITKLGHILHIVFHLIERSAPVASGNSPNSKENSEKFLPQPYFDVNIRRDTVVTSAQKPILTPLLIKLIINITALCLLRCELDFIKFNEIILVTLKQKDVYVNLCMGYWSLRGKHCLNSKAKIQKNKCHFLQCRSAMRSVLSYFCHNVLVFYFGIVI